MADRGAALKLPDIWRPNRDLNGPEASSHHRHGWPSSVADWGGAALKSPNKKEPRHRSRNFTKINSMGITDINVKCNTIKLLEYYIEENLVYLGYGDDFFRYNTKE